MRDQWPVHSRDADARKPGAPTDQRQQLCAGALIGDWILWLFFGGIFGWSWQHPRTGGSANRERSVEYLVVSIERSQ